MAGSAPITTVVTAATTYDLVALSVLKDDLQITVTTSDAYLARQITRASLDAAQYCNRVFPAETLQDRWLATPYAQARILGGRFTPLQLSRYPLVSVTSVIENGLALIAEIDFTIDQTLGQVLRLDDSGAVRSWCPSAVTVVYVAGYATIPADIQGAVVSIVKARQAARTRDPMLRSETIPGVAANAYWVGGTDTGALPPDACDILNNYRTPVTA